MAVVVVVPYSLCVAGDDVFVGGIVGRVQAFNSDAADHLIIVVVVVVVVVAVDVVVVVVVVVPYSLCVTGDMCSWVASLVGSMHSTATWPIT